MTDEKVDLLGLTGLELMAQAKHRLVSGHGLWRAILRDALGRGVFEPERHEMSARSAALWREHFQLRLPTIARGIEEPASDAVHGEMTKKLVLRAHDGLELESVLIPMGRGRYTLCVSSQVGCKLACTFCETGKMGLLRNLSAAEIVAQVVVARIHFADTPVRKIVFMGMGEPLDNPDNVIQALRVLNDPRGLSYAQERITVCTAGVPDGIRRLGELGWKRLDVALSLNAADDDKRDRIMPINKRHDLAELQAALVAYPRRKTFVYAINYCLLPGINDTAADARAIAEFCGPLGRALVNLIPYNPGTSPISRAPEEPEIEQFLAWLSEAGVPARRRVTKGRSVMAACGQLGNPSLRNKRVLPVLPPDGASG